MTEKINSFDFYVPMDIPLVLEGGAMRGVFEAGVLDVFIEKRKLDLNNSIALINNPKITVTDVAKELNINRSTIHRNKELTDRIEKANEELLAIKNKTGNLNEHIKMLEHEIELLKKREQDYMLLKESYNQLVDAFTNSN